MTAKGGGDVVQGVGKGVIASRIAGSTVVVEHASFDGPGTTQAPVGSDDFFDQTIFEVVDGLEPFQERVHYMLKAFLRFVLENQATRKETMTQGVPRGALLAFRRDGSFRKAAVCLG